MLNGYLPDEKTCKTCKNSNGRNIEACKTCGLENKNWVLDSLIGRKIKELLTRVDGKLYGDLFIGYRIQGADGKYYDTELKEIYDTVDCEEFCSTCSSLRSGGHNWSKE